MSDIADHGSDTAEHFLAHDLAAHRARQAAEAALPVNTSGLCADCDEPIDPRRLDANPRVLRCVPCQVERDRRR